MVWIRIARWYELLRQIELLDGSVVHAEARPGRGGHGLLVGVHALEGPARPAEVPEETQVEAVAAADVEDARVLGKALAPREQPLRFEAAPHLEHQAEALLGEVVGVVGRRVDPPELRDVGPRVEVDEAAALAPHGLEGVGARVVLEVFAHRDGLRVVDAADAARHVDELEGCHALQHGTAGKSRLRALRTRRLSDWLTSHCGPRGYTAGTRSPSMGRATRRILTGGVLGVC